MYLDNFILYIRRNAYGEVILRMRSDDRPPNEREGAIHYYIRNDDDKSVTLC